MHEIDMNNALHNLDDLKLIHSLDLLLANWNRTFFSKSYHKNQYIDNLI